MCGTAIFADPELRPDECKEVDPDNTNCQLMGKFKVELNDYNSKPLKAGMGELCEGHNPDYNRGSSC